MVRCRSTRAFLTPLAIFCASSAQCDSSSSLLHLQPTHHISFHRLLLEDTLRSSCEGGFDVTILRADYLGLLHLIEASHQH
jgi:hypothetical protein